MRWETQGIARVVFSVASHGSIMGDASCVLCSWTWHITPEQSFDDVIEEHVRIAHPEAVNSLGIQSAPEDDDAVGYFVVINAPEASAV